MADRSAQFMDRFFNQSIMLETLSKLLSLILPLLRIRRFISFAKRLFSILLRYAARKKREKFQIADDADDADDAEVRESERTKKDSCHICGSLSMLYRVKVNPCGHEFCYHCIESHRLTTIDDDDDDDDEIEIDECGAVDCDDDENHILYINNNNDDSVFPCPACERSISVMKMVFFGEKREE